MFGIESFTSFPVFDDHPDWLYLNQIQSNQTVRDLYISAYSDESDTNWYEYWWTVWGDKLEEYEDAGYDIPNISRPIIWGSEIQWAISEHSLRLQDNLMDGRGQLNWTFAVLGNESALTDLIQDLYAKRLPFIANLYSPHSDFSTKLENDTEYMEFEKIALPRNPNNDVQSTCYLDGTCNFPISPLVKLSRPNLEDEFKEMYDFVLDYSMVAEDVNQMITFHKNINESLNLTAHEKWQYAACQWLKLDTTASTIDLWFQSITRYDCIFDDTENCGFDYYYNSYDDAVNEQNAVTISWDDSIAGDCSYDSKRALCECPERYFVGDSCQTSCDGVIGPILNDNYNGDYLNESRFVSSENYVFYLCSGRGICDIDKQSCACEDGYGGDGCEVEYDVFEYDLWMIICWSAVFVICIIVLSLSMNWIYMNQKYKTVKALSPSLVYVFTIGLILMIIGNILYLFHPITDALCIARTYLSGIGGMYCV